VTSKASSILDKVQKELQRNSVPKALEKLEEGIRKHPDEFELYLSALDIALEAGESVKAQKYFSKGMSLFPSYQERMWTEAVGLISRFNDVVLAKAAIDFAVKKRDFDSAQGVLGYLNDAAVKALLKRVQTKKLSLSNAAGGGMALSSERLVNAFAEALLFVRLNQHSEGARILLDIVTEKPIEHKKLSTFFYNLEKTHSSEPGYTYGLGRCYLAGERYEKAIPKIMEAVEKNWDWVEDAIERLKAIKDETHVPPEEYNLSMSRLYIMNGDLHEANERIRLVLAKNHRAAPAVLDLLESEVMEIGDNLILDYLYIDAALQADRVKAALKQLRRIYRIEKHKDDLLQWFKTRQKGILAVELLAYYGEIALEQEMYEKAVEVLRQVVTQSPYEAGTIRELLDKHTSNELVRAFHEELIAESDSEAPETSDEGGFKIEHLGGGTKFSAPKSPGQDRRKEDKKPANPFRDNSPFASNRSRPAIEMDGEPEPDTEEKRVEEQWDSGSMTFIEREVSLDNPEPDTMSKVEKRAGPAWAKEREREITFGSEEIEETPEPIDEKPTEPKIEAGTDAVADPDKEPEEKDASARKARISFNSDTKDAVAVDKPEEKEIEKQAAPEKQAVIEEPADKEPEKPVAVDEPADEEPVAVDEPADEQPEEPVAVDEPADEQPEEPIAEDEPADEQPEEPVAVDEPAHNDPEEPVAVDEPDDEEPAADTKEPVDKSAMSFDELFNLFKEKELEPDEALDLAQRAMDSSRLDDMREILTFEPETDEQARKRNVYLADYYMVTASPGEALKALEAIEIDNIDGEERKHCLIRLAACYQKLSRFEAAQRTHAKLIGENPGFKEADETISKNYRKYLREIVDGAMVLEKVTDV